MTLAQLNALDEDAFTEALGSLYERSPWIARLAARQRPFADARALEAALSQAAAGADGARKIALIRAHPDLAGRVAREGRLTPASSAEQASVGLDRLSDAERARFDELNHAYRERFGFPFVICVREHTKASILDAMERRVRNAPVDEIATALREIDAIARLRLHDLLEHE